MNEAMADVVAIIPTIRIDEWLSVAVCSMLAQQDCRVHVVVVHDGVSPEPSQTWMRDDRVTALHSEDRVGLAAVLTRAIGETNEGLIARLDADDISLPDRLAEQVKYLAAHPETVLVGSQGLRIDEFGKISGRVDSVIGADVRRSLLTRNVLVHSSVLFRREAYVLAGGFDPTLRLMEDYDLWLRMAHVGPIAVMPNRFIQYRVHSAQMTRGAKPVGPYIRKVLASHRNLARALGVNRGEQIGRMLFWLGAQHLRYWRIRKPGYDR